MMITYVYTDALSGVSALRFTLKETKWGYLCASSQIEKTQEQIRNRRLRYQMTHSHSSSGPLTYLETRLV